MFLLAYIGPGAGFAAMGSFLILFAALALGLLTLFSLPFRLLVSLFRRRVRGRFRRCIIVGFDGMDPRRVTALMDAGRLPHLAQLRATGTFARLATTCPPISPVAWSTFATGVNPGKHGIFDFLSRDPRTCLPELSSARITPKGAELLRKSRPFWHLLGENGVFSTVLRVPVTFPPERFRGLCLSAMCTPDIRGTQGEFTVFQSASPAGTTTGGRRIQVVVTDEPGAHRRVRTALPGPTLHGRERSLPITVTWLGEQGFKAQGSAEKSHPDQEQRTTNHEPRTKNHEPPQAELRVAGRKVRLRPGVFSPWVRLTYRAGFTCVDAIARFLLIETEPGFKLYVTPLNIDPERPALPISWPASYCVYLAKQLGAFATVGLAEDTWALTEGVLDDAAFLRQAQDIHAEREAMCLNALRRTRRGLCACVFDLTDRVQHTFMRTAECLSLTPEPQPPTAAERPVSAIDDAYDRCDASLGRILDRLGPQDLLFVLSDHGFAAFRRGVNLNAWLRETGYLSLKPDAAGEDFLRTVDWSRTRAYSFGLAGLCLNLAGRELHGTVPQGEAAQALKDEIATRLRTLVDPLTGQPVVREVYDAAATYTGPYVDRAPDLIVGWRSGYRHSWETAVGRTDGPVFADNAGKWGGDHCVDRTEVPGVLFCNQPLAFPDRGPHIVDLAPTVLALWHVPLPGYLDGVAWKVE